MTWTLFTLLQLYLLSSTRAFISRLLPRDDFIPVCSLFADISVGVSQQTSAIVAVFAVAEIKRNSTCIALRCILFDRRLLVLSNYARASRRLANEPTAGMARDFFVTIIFSKAHSFFLLCRFSVSSFTESREAIDSKPFRPSSVANLANAFSSNALSNTLRGTAREYA